MRDFQPVLDAEVVTPQMEAKRAALSGRTIEPAEEAPAAGPDFTSDMAAFRGGPFRAPSVSRDALEAEGLPVRAPETPVEIPERYRNMSFLPADRSPHNPNLSLEERERNALLLEREFEIEPDEEKEEKPAPAPRQRRVVLTAAMVGQMTDDEIDDWIERHSS
jgi:hypothetical protein